MAGFVRRYSFFPGADVIAQIEGAVIVDLPPPGSIQGVGVGTACIVGEFADMTYAVAVSSSGVVTTFAQPVELFSAQDMLDKLGGWDETIGEFGGDGGNGFVDIRGKKFSRLVAVPINLASSNGIRVFRDLPTNKSATDTTPTVPMSAASVAAGREFKSGANRVRLAKRVSFSDTAAYKTAVDGATAGATAVTQVFTSATGDFVTNNVQKGDILVVGVIGAAGAQGSDSGTFRVVSRDSATQLTVEKFSGASFTWVVGASLAYRLHAAATADTGLQNQASDVAGYLVPARPLDVTIAAATLLTPTVVPAAGTATFWDSLSGLGSRTMPGGGGGLTFTAAIQAPNAPSVGSIDTLYTTAIDSLISEDLPAREVNIIWAARKSSTIRSKLKSHVLTVSGNGRGRRAILSPSVDVLAIATAIGDADPGVGANRDERVDYSWPGARTFIPEASGYTLLGADGSSVTDGTLDLPMDSWLASVESTIAPERNPGEASPTTALALSSVLGFQRGVTGLGIGEYTQLRQKGVAALRMDRTVGPIIQSGITSSLTSGQKNINRRRMADYIEDSAAERLVQFSKLPLTNQLKDGAAGEVVAFLSELLSANNPAAQRITAFEVDTKSGNTASLEARGIFVIIARVRTLATADFIVLQAEIGEGVTVTAT